MSEVPLLQIQRGDLLSEVPLRKIQTYHTGEPRSYETAHPSRTA